MGEILSSSTTNIDANILRMAKHLMVILA